MKCLFVGCEKSKEDPTKGKAGFANNQTLTKHCVNDHKMKKIKVSRSS